MKMKNKIHIDWLAILLIFVFGFNLIIHVFLYIEEQNIYNLISVILYPSCLVIYILSLFFIKIYNEKRFIIIYNNFFEIYDNNIFESNFIYERKNTKYLKYGVNDSLEKKYIFNRNNLFIDFGIFKLDKNRKLMVIYKIKTSNVNFYEEFLKSKEVAEKHYYENNKVDNLQEQNVFYKNKRNAFQIKEINGGYYIAKYRYYIPIEIHNIKLLQEYSTRWEFIGDLIEEGLEYFDSYEKAKDYVLSWKCEENIDYKITKEHKYYDLHCFENILKLYYSKNETERIIMCEKDGSIIVRLQKLEIYQSALTKTIIHCAAWKTEEGKGRFFVDLDSAIKEYQFEIDSREYTEENIKEIAEYIWNDNPEYFADIFWFKESNGGRKTIPYGTRYWPQVIVIGSNNETPNHSIVLRNIEGVSKYKTTAIVKYAYNGAPNDFDENSEFYVCEGNKKVAKGIIKGKRENFDV